MFDKLDNIPRSLQNHKAFVLWKYIEQGEGKKPLKMPYYAQSGLRRRGPHGSQEDRRQLVDLKNATKVLKTGKYTGIGMAMLSDWGLVAVDFDNCINDGTVDPEVLHLVDPTYWEISPSGKGIRAFFKGCVRDGKAISSADIEKRGWGVEFFCSKGFVTVTGNVTPERELIGYEPIPLSDEIKALYADAIGKRNLNTINCENLYTEISPKIMAALKVIPADDYHTWIKIGMSLKSEFGDDAFTVWESWSSNSPNFQDGECEKKWASFKQNDEEKAVGIGSLYFMAKQYGFVYDTTAKTDKNLQEWQQPRLLPAKYGKPLSLTENQMPEILAQWTRDIADRMCVPLDMVAVPALAVLSSLVARQFTISPKENDNWEVYPNLWGAVIATPAMKKSPILNAVSAPLSAVAEKSFLKAEGEYQDKLRQFEITDIEIQKLKNDLKTATGKEHEDIAHKLEALLETKPSKDFSPPRFIVNDTTPEKIADLFKQNPRGFLLLRDELSGWFEEFNKSGYESARQFYLSCWNGGGSTYIDRVGRGSTYVQNLTLSVIGTIQPGVMESYVQNALSKGKNADGMLQRFQLVVWSDQLPEYKHMDVAPNHEAIAKIEEFVNGIVSYEEPLVSLKFTKAAQEIFTEWLVKHENHLRQMDSDQPGFSSHLGKYASLLASLALIFHIIENVDALKNDGIFSDVGASSLNYAFEWLTFLESHAKRLYRLELNSGVEEAHLLLDKMKQGRITDGMTIREIHRSGWKGLGSRDAVDGGLRVLEEHDFIQLKKILPEKGRPSQVIYINPSIEDFCQF